MKKPQRTTKQAIAKIKELRKRLFTRAIYNIHKPEGFTAAMKKAHNIYARLLVKQVLNEMGIKSKLTEAKICSRLLEKQKVEVKLAGDVFGKTKAQSVRDSGVEQIQAAQREAICEFLGKENGEKFWKRYKSIMGER